MLCPLRLVEKHVLRSPCLILSSVSFYSKRSNFGNQNVYKIVGKAGRSIDETGEHDTELNTNWELLAPKGYRFYLPGNVGPAWHDQYSTAQFVDLNDLSLTDGIPTTSNNRTLECVAQVCPLLLRRGVLEMFPGMSEVGGSQLTIVTLSQKSSKNLTTDAREVEQEKQVKTFVLVAQEICLKLNLAGYWADFINPFSGRPYLSASFKNALYETDQRFRCLGFEIINKNNCKVIDSQQKVARKFVGSLFTTAPANMTLLKDVLNEYDESS